MKKTHTPKGFAVIEIIIVLALLAVIIGLGWYAWHGKHKASAPAATTTQTQTSTGNVATVTDPTVNWTAYSSTAGQYSLRYPTSWVQAKTPSDCSAGLLLLGPDTKSVGSCGSEGFGEIYIAPSNGDDRATYELGSGHNYSDITKVAVTVDGVSGYKESGTVTGQQADQALDGLPNNTKTVLYIFYTNGRTYVAAYNQTPSDPDALSDFNLLVTKTLKFSS